MSGLFIRPRSSVVAAVLAFALSSLLPFSSHAQSNSDVPFWMKVTSWAQSVSGAISKQFAIRRDSNLKRFAGELSWVEGKYRIAIIIDRIIAENERQARELANAQATKEHPIITLMLEGKDVIPPYVTDPRAALVQWKMTEMPLKDSDRELAKEG
jgi:hypothetical protein